MVGYSSKGGPTMVLAQGLYELLSQGVAHRSEWGEGGGLFGGMAGTRILPSAQPYISIDFTYLLHSISTAPRLPTAKVLVIGQESF